MTPFVDNNIKVPYEIGSFIASQVSYLDSKVRGIPWADHKGHFEAGPNPIYCQMRQGMLLEVVNSNRMPRAIHTRYGRWTLLASNQGSFDKVFEVVSKTLNLRKVEELSNEIFSFWAIQTWDGKTIEEPIKADKSADEFISYGASMSAYHKFKASL